LRAANPANNRIVRLFELEPPLNPYADDRVKIVGVTLYGELANSKAIAGYHMLTEAKRLGKLEGIHTLAVPTSGNFGSTLAVLAGELGIEHVEIYVRKDAPRAKTDATAILPGTSIRGYDPKTENGLMLAEKSAQEAGVLFFNQYGDWSNVEAHITHTGPAIWFATRAQVTVVVAAAGSGGTLGGVGLFLKMQNDRIVTVRAVVAPGEEIPAGRTLAQIKKDVTLPLAPDAFNFTLECHREAALRQAIALGSQIPARPGPTSGEAYQVALDWVAEMKQAGTLDNYRNKHGDVYVAVLLPDSIELYAERITGSLDYSKV